MQRAVIEEGKTGELLIDQEGPPLRVVELADSAGNGNGRRDVAGQVIEDSDLETQGTSNLDPSRKPEDKFALRL
ncbi:MAG: hypothetical protein WAN87_02685 [Thermoplasmata archaeon]